MKHNSDIQDLRDVNFAEIEKRARMLRAQAVRDSFAAFKKALGSIQITSFGKRAGA